MLKPYELLENILLDIEKGIKNGINIDALADKFTLSERHLRKLFKFAFNQSLGSYIHSRKLTASLDDLLYTNLKIINIAIILIFIFITLNLLFKQILLNHLSLVL